MGANEYVNKLRIEKSMDLLRNTEMSITEMAERIGFSSSRYFSTAFKNIQGLLLLNLRNLLENLIIR